MRLACRSPVFSIGGDPYPAVMFLDMVGEWSKVRAYQIDLNVETR